MRDNLRTIQAYVGVVLISAITCFAVGAEAQRGVRGLAPGNVSGTVTVEGGAPRPLFQLTLTDAAGHSFTPLARGAFKASNTGWTPIAADFGESASFTLDLPSGEYRVALTGLPSGYVLRSMSAGAADLTADPLRVSGADPVIQIRLGVTAGPPWVKVGGKVSGAASRIQQMPPARSVSKPATEVGLTGALFSQTIRAAIHADGSFEFPLVLPGVYEIHVLPTNAETDRGGTTINVGSQGASVDLVAQPMRYPGGAGD